jgi:hypothetical protein
LPKGSGAVNLEQLQQHLRQTGRYSGTADGLWGRLTEAGILLALTDGPDTKLCEADFAAAGSSLGVQPAAIKAFWQTEAAGAGFQDGRPKILPEPHRFSKNTGHRFDASHPTISYPRWGTRPYVRTQDERYDQLLQMVRLDIDAGFASASYGAPQIMGENFAVCGYASSFAFAEAMARDEATQLRAFMEFVKGRSILPFLQRVTRFAASWEPVAQRYNGTAFRQNRYHEKMAASFAAFGGQ